MSTVLSSPFEIKVKNSFLNASGIAVTISVGSATRIHEVYLSYIVYGNSQNYESGVI